MKKFFEKYDLIKVSGILVLVAVILTWLFPYSYFNGTQLVEQEITRVGITNFFQYAVDGLRYFTVLATFLFVTGGFYQVLSKRPGYQKLVKTIGEKLKGREIPVVLFVSLIFSCLGSLVTEYYPLLAIIPFVITIYNIMKIDKITAFVSTFGGLLVGALGSTYSTKVAGAILEGFKADIADVLTTQSILFVITFVALNIFMILRLNKTKKDKKFEEYDKFAIDMTSKDEKKADKKSVKVWPYALMFALMFLTISMAYLPWEKYWEITLWKEVTTWLNEFSIAGVPILSYITGTLKEFGAWDIYHTMFVMLFATLLVKCFGKVSFDEIIESFGEGFQKIASTVVAMLAVYLVLEFAFEFPVLPAVIAWFESLTTGFSAFFASLGAFVTSIFSVEMQYGIALTGTYYATAYADKLSTLVIIFQSMFGLVSFFIPSSAILMIGLSYLDIKYKDWMKFIWKFLLIMFLIIAVMIAIIA